AQGGSVVKALLLDSSYAVRAVTRDVSKPAAVKLKEAGAEVVAADMNDEKSLKSAFSGAYGAFVVTNFFDHFSKEKEFEQGKRIADICKLQGLKHVVFSGLENVHKLTGGKLKVLHFDGKGEVEEYFRQIKVPMTSTRLAFYFENYLTSCRPKKCPDGKTYQLGADEMANMFRFYHMRPDRNVELTHKLNPDLKTFKQFMVSKKDTFKDL
ncbi:hypothetical protein AB205_0082030, partial [Aquarana catesbeiana]